MKKIISLVLVAMMIATMAVAVSADTSVTIADLAEASDFVDAGYTGKVLHIGNNGGSKCMGTWDLSGVSKIVVSYGSDPGAPINAHKIYVNDAEGNTIGSAQLSQEGGFWAQGQRTVEIAISSEYNGALYITKDATEHQIAIDAITLVGEASGDTTGGTPSTPSNPETGDSFVVAVVTVAMIALAGVVVSKKVRA